MTIKNDIKSRVYEVLGSTFAEPKLYFKDEQEPTEDNPIVRFVLVSPFFDDKDTKSKDTFLQIRDVIEAGGIFEEFKDYLVVVMPMGRAEYERNGNSIFKQAAN